MKEMNYSANRFDTPEVLAVGDYMGYHYIILSLGTHPTAYVEIPDSDFFYEMSYNDVNEYLDVHGGFTFSDSWLRIVIKDTWLIGWDYAHAGDLYGPSDVLGGKEWTTEEIYEEVRHVINQIIQVNMKQGD